MIPRGHQRTNWMCLHTYTCRALLFRIETRLALEAYQIPVNKRPLQSNIPLLCTLVHRRGTLRVGDGGVPFSSRTAAVLTAVKRLFAHRSQVTHLLVSRYPQDVTKRAISPRSGFKAVGVIKVFITNSNLHDSLPRAAESKWKVLESCLHTSFDNSCVLASWGATLARVGRTGTHRMEVMSTNHVFQDLATAPAQGEASGNQAPASAAGVVNLAGG